MFSRSRAFQASAVVAALLLGGFVLSPPDAEAKRGDVRTGLTVDKRGASAQLAKGIGGFGDARELAAALQEIVAQLQRVIRKLKQPQASEDPGAGRLKPLPKDPPRSTGGGSNATGLDSSTGRPAPSRPEEVRQQLQAFLAQNRMFFPQHALNLMQSFADQGNVVAFQDVARRSMGVGGFPCATHQVLHDCNTHCEMMHGPGFNLLKPACQAGCSIDNNIFKPAFQALGKFLQNLGKKISGR